MWKIYDTPTTPAAVVGSAGHKALEHFYSGAGKEIAVRLGLEYMQKVGDFEINFGRAKTRRAKKEKRKKMEQEYLRAISYYLKRPPRHRVLGVEVKGMVKFPDFRSQSRRFQIW